MGERYVYEYAVVRVVPRVEREEFVNAGVILYCEPQGFLRGRWRIDPARWCVLAPGLDAAAVAAHLAAMDAICLGSHDSGPIGTLDRGSRFRWLAAVRSATLQSSPIHAGYCLDATAALEEIYAQMVG